jgi:putative DNA methylase
MNYPKRLIEVDLPIKEISAHARREKSIRHGHISTLHIWWARRPLAACRAVLCAALWPDPVDELCPQAFREQTAKILVNFAEQVRTKPKIKDLCANHWTRWYRTNETTLKPNNPGAWNEMRYALLDFIADFANWDASTVPEFLETARALTQSAHEALGGIPGTRPLVVDPFAGGGSIPLEALRVGADAFASDLNPVAVLLNKVVLEYIPKYGNYEFTMQDEHGNEIAFHGLADAVRYWGNWIKEQAEQELAEFYPKDPDGSTPIAYLWARTITCEGPGCGAEVPLMRSFWLAKKKNRSVALKILTAESAENRREKQEETNGNTLRPSASSAVNSSSPAVQFEIFEPASPKEVGEGTVKRGAATCPCCGYTTPVESVRKQLKARRGGAHDARLFAVVTTKPGQQGRFYRLPTERDLEAVRKASVELERRKAEHTGELSLVPDEPTPQGGGSGAGRAFSQRNYGMDRFEDLFTPRQALALSFLAKLIRGISKKSIKPNDFIDTIQTCLALALNKQADSNSSLCAWRSTSQDIGHTFGRQALPIVWDFVEGNIISGATRDWMNAIEGVLKAINSVDEDISSGHADRIDAANHLLPDDSAKGFISDPPYYDAVPYADLSDFFFVWLKRTIGEQYKELFKNQLTPKDDECILDEIKGKDKAYFEKTMGKIMAEGRRILAPDGIGAIVFAHKSTSGWEAQLQAMIDAGWMMTGSWPIDTEMGSRLRAKDSAALASSVHLVCRPRENEDGTLREEIGDWRDVLQALPERIHEWMPRLAREGIVGADAIFACLGPALEIFSQYSRVEKASGEIVTLGEYLEHVWAAVSREALELLFEGADTSGFDQDARLTAMWLWTLSTNFTAEGAENRREELQGFHISKEKNSLRPSAASAVESKVVKSTGYTLEYDTARKIAQGLGAHLEQLSHTVEIKKDKARLLPVSERRKYLLGKNGPSTGSGRTGGLGTGRTASRKASHSQMSFSDTTTEAGFLSETAILDDSVEQIGKTILDQVHQSMLLFADGRGETLRRFLVDEGIGKDSRFWKLADCLSKLYPPQTDEKRWVDGVLARKKGLGL